MATIRRKYRLQLPDRTLLLGGQTLVMGVLNVTPDSFSDGGKFLDVDWAVERALEMEREGADLIDVGGESTAPGSRRVPFEEELHRVVPVLERLRGKVAVPLSIDTYKAEVAARALKLGVSLINDVSGGDWDPKILEVARQGRAGLVIMHMRGDPQNWRSLSPRRAVVQSVLKELRERCERARAAGISRQQILVDPGIGFGKNPLENVKLLGRLETFNALGYPLLIGTSRKSFLGKMGQRTPEERLLGTMATVAIAALKGAHMVRVHDVKEAVQVVRVADAIRETKI